MVVISDEAVTLPTESENKPSARNELFRLNAKNNSVKRVKFHFSSDFQFGFLNFQNVRLGLFALSRWFSRTDKRPALMLTLEGLEGSNFNLSFSRCRKRRKMRCDEGPDPDRNRLRPLIDDDGVARERLTSRSTVLKDRRCRESAITRARAAPALRHLISRGR